MTITGSNLDKIVTYNRFSPEHYYKAEESVLAKTLIV